jgi:hypothetical protein
MRGHHHSPKKSTRINHEILCPWSIPSVSSVRRKRRSPKAYILQGELRKINPPTFNVEHKKGE